MSDSQESKSPRPKMRDLNLSRNNASTSTPPPTTGARATVASPREPMEIFPAGTSPVSSAAMDKSPPSSARKNTGLNTRQRAIATNDDKRRSNSSPVGVDPKSIESAQEARLRSSNNTVKPKKPPAGKFTDILETFIEPDDDDFIDKPPKEIPLRPKEPPPPRPQQQPRPLPRDHRQSRLTDKIQERFNTLSEHSESGDNISPRPAVNAPTPAEQKAMNRGSRMALPSVSKLLSTRPESWVAPMEKYDSFAEQPIGEKIQMLSSEHVERVPSLDIDALIEDIVGPSTNAPPTLIDANAYQCTICLETIRNYEVIQSHGLYYHESCFTCSSCGVALSVDLFFRDESNIFCESCRNKLAQKCTECSTPIFDSLVRDNITQDLYHEQCYADLQRRRSELKTSKEEVKMSPSNVIQRGPKKLPPTPPRPSRPPPQASPVTPQEAPIRPSLLSPRQQSIGNFDASSADKFGFTSDDKIDAAPETKNFVSKMPGMIFSSFKRAKNSAANSVDWDDYVASLNDNLDNIKPSSTLKTLIRTKGIPPKLKEAVWVRITSVYEAYKKNMNCYENVLSIKGIATNLSTAQIQKDIDRTFPNNVYFKTDQGRQSLFRVLHAFSWVNPDIGYCQSMNFLAGLILLFASEESTFWLVSTIVEELLPADYYTPNMNGIRADTLVFNALMNERMPQLMKHLESTGIDLTMFTTQWFLCLYINYLPVDVTVWFLDSFFSEGSKMLFRVALALFSMHKSLLLKTTDIIQLMDLVKSLPKRVQSIQSLSEHCFNQPLASNLKREKIEELRTKALAEITSSSSTTVKKATSTKGDFNFFDRPSGESSRRLQGWASLQIIENYTAFELYKRMPAAQRKGALALSDSSS